MLVVMHMVGALLNPYENNALIFLCRNMCVGLTLICLKQDVSILLNLLDFMTLQ